eukprot:ANDGO_07153.mRNA.1 hypothetical protein
MEVASELMLVRYDPNDSGLVIPQPKSVRKGTNKTYMDTGTTNAVNLMSASFGRMALSAERMDKNTTKKHAAYTISSSEKITVRMSDGRYAMPSVRITNSTLAPS